MVTSRDLLAASIGGVIGALITKTYLKKVYEARIDRDVESVKSAFAKKYETKGDNEENKDPLTSMKKIIHKQDYSNKKKEANKATVNLEVVAPDTVGDLDDYEIESLFYYSDGTVRDEDQHELTKSEIRDYVGLDFSEHFGEYEDDTVYIRNDDTQKYYEILKRKFSEV